MTQVSRYGGATAHGTPSRGEVKLFEAKQRALMARGSHELLKMQIGTGLANAAVDYSDGLWTRANASADPYPSARNEALHAIGKAHTGMMTSIIAGFGHG